MNELEIIDYKGCKIKVYYDECPESPRKWDNAATFVCGHTRYRLGDKQNIENELDLLLSRYVDDKSVIEYFCKSRNAQLDPEEVDGERWYRWTTRCCGQDCEHWICAIQSPEMAAGEMLDELSENEKLELIEDSGKVAIMPISIYDHSGVSMWLGSPLTGGMGWDSGCVGFAYITIDDAAEYSCRILSEADWKKWAYSIMESEMEVYNDYLQGYVYGFEAVDENGDEIDSCWGYYGDLGKSDMIEEAQGSIDNYIDKRAAKYEVDKKTFVDKAMGYIGHQWLDGGFIYRIATDLFGFPCLERAAVVRGCVGGYCPCNLSEVECKTLSLITQNMED